ncbi:zinc ABC transporter substrate-binding protein [Aerococcaceae bacterium NML201209]|nr:zinc ABC transporter substrate-binding protein [Aerococcaceae bacterium NML201209]MCW6664206.1 zinc ABC transporter substrate-binding protein [Aerococcaceae bacterium NML191219]MCW6674718.1 zinc ABC transporter substrate-binding protein [Aerococcaceae bacterium NML171108]MCW6679738.1 zinc ABC transporter substrate-binding protein [Aerococcaceae bacterium NML130460]
MKLKQLLAGIAVLFLTLGQFSTVAAANQKKVMTTFYPVYYLAQRIAGDKMEVSMLLDSNQDPHDYESSARDAATVQQSDIFIYQDDEMEHFVSDMVKLLDTSKTKIVESTEDIELLAGDMHEHDDHEHEEGESHDDHADHDHDHSHEFDPHTWMDPMIYAKQAENVKKALIEVDPDNKAVYEANAKALVEELTQLDAEYREQLAKLENKTIVVQHAAFGYLAHAYGLTQEAITGIQTTQEPSAAALAAMQDFVKAHQVKTIFVEPSLNPATAKVVADASGATLRPLRTLESVTQEEIEKGEDYFTIMRANLAELLQN